MARKADLMNLIGTLTPYIDTTRGDTLGLHTAPFDRGEAPGTSPRRMLSRHDPPGHDPVHRSAEDAPANRPSGSAYPPQCGWTAAPMNNAERKTKIYACKNATNNSRRLRQITPPMLAGITR